MGHEAAEGCQSWGMMQPLGRERDGGGERERERAQVQAREREDLGVWSVKRPNTRNKENA